MKRFERVCPLWPLCVTCSKHCFCTYTYLLHTSWDIIAFHYYKNVHWILCRHIIYKLLYFTLLSFSWTFWYVMPWNVLLLLLHHIQVSISFAYRIISYHFLFHLTRLPLQSPTHQVTVVKEEEVTLSLTQDRKPNSISTLTILPLFYLVLVLTEQFKLLILLLFGISIYKHHVTWYFVCC